MMKIEEKQMLDIKAGIAVGIADLLPKPDRVETVAGTLRCDEDEARRLIARGRRLVRDRERAA